MYGILSLPYFFFRLPILSNLLTHARPTGYNQYGKLVLCLKKKPMMYEASKKYVETEDGMSRGDMTLPAMEGRESNIGLMLNRRRGKIIEGEDMKEKLKAE
jgi:hypothetical protein